MSARHPLLPGRTIAGSVAVILLVAAAGCHKPPSTGDSPLPELMRTARVEDSPPPASPPRVLPARCRPADPPLVIDPTSAGLGIGDAIESPSGYAVAILHRTPRGLVAGIGLLGPDARGPVRIADLGPTLGDAPPPRLALRGTELIAAAYGLSSKDDPRSDGNKVRDLILYTVSDAGTASAWVDVPQQRDDSLAFDVAFAASDPAAQGGGVVVWDEASSAGHGVIRVASVRSGEHGPTSRDLSPPDSDAELPRIISNGAGYIALWIARRPEPVTGADASTLEATGESRSYGWIESLALDEHGVSRGAVKRLTPTDGHVSTYDARMLAGAAKPTLLVVARDESEAVDASGGDLLRVRVVGESVEPPVAFSNDGLGRGAPALVDGNPPWLVWVDPHEQLRLMPLDATGAPVGRPSAEDEMNDARPLLVLRAHAERPPQPLDDGKASGWGRVLVASPLDAHSQIRVFSCAP